MNNALNEWDRILFWWYFPEYARSLASSLTLRNLRRLFCIVRCSNEVDVQIDQ